MFYYCETKQSIPSYHQSVTSLQQEYLQACDDAIESTIEFQRKFATKAGINTKVPEATLKAVHETSEQVVKSFDVQNKMALATVDAARQNVKTYTNNAKAYSGLNIPDCIQNLETFTQHAKMFKKTTLHQGIWQANCAHITLDRPQASW